MTSDLVLMLLISQCIHRQSWMWNWWNARGVSRKYAQAPLAVVFETRPWENEEKSLCLKKIRTDIIGSGLWNKAMKKWRKVVVSQENTHKHHWQWFLKQGHGNGCRPEFLKQQQNQFTLHPTHVTPHTCHSFPLSVATDNIHECGFKEFWPGMIGASSVQIHATLSLYQ